MAKFQKWREKCEEKLAEMIPQKEAEIAAEKDSEERIRK